MCVNVLMFTSPTYSPPRTQAVGRWLNRYMGMAYEKWLQNVRDAKRVIALLVHNKKKTLSTTHETDLANTRTFMSLHCVHTHMGYAGLDSGLG
jgi:hypothetical protein